MTDIKGKVFVLEASDGGHVFAVNPDGSGKQVLVSGCRIPDGITVDADRGHIYWTNMGDDDRRDQTRWCVGIAVDPGGRHLYWTQKGPGNAGLGKILRAGLELPVGDDAAARSDIELLYDRLPEPIDLELDLRTRTLYWTDRGDPPRGNTVNRAPMDPVRGQPEAPEILWTHLEEGIGIALDLAGDRMWVTDLAGSIYLAELDGAGHQQILVAQGNLTGIAYAEL